MIRLTPEHKILLRVTHGRPKEACLPWSQRAMALIFPVSQKQMGLTDCDSGF